MIVCDEAAGSKMMPPDCDDAVENKMMSHDCVDAVGSKVMSHDCDDAVRSKIMSHDCDETVRSKMILHDGLSLMMQVPPKTLPVEGATTTESSDAVEEQQVSKHRVL